MGPAMDVDESKLPQGNCRYIMLVPEIKGHRCACVSFTLNKSLPGAICECGHLACFHQRTAEAPIDKQELDLLRQRLDQLEQLVSRQPHNGNELVQRVSELEGIVETRTDDMSQEIKKTYGNLNRAWHSIGELERRSGDYDRQFQGLKGHLQEVDGELQRLHDRQCELNDADLNLEEQFLELEERFEDWQDDNLPTRGRQRRQSWSNPAAPLSRSSEIMARRPRSNISMSHRSTAPTEIFTNPVTPTRMPLRPMPSAASKLWTVHISLLPNNESPFPFERDTNAYKRCLSRGLHQMVPVSGTSAEAFTTAVSHAFSSLLKGRAWVPLQAKLCDAETLQGLPMLRSLDTSLLDSPYDLEFLRTHCAVLDVHGNIDSLYITMRHSKLSWHALRYSPVFLPGLEPSWDYDPMLDAGDPFEDDENVDDSNRPPAGDLVGSLPNLKRAASEISRSSSFGAAMVSGGAADTAEQRPPKVPRTPCPLPNIRGVRRQQVETA